MTKQKNKEPELQECFFCGGCASNCAVPVMEWDGKMHHIKSVDADYIECTCGCKNPKAGEGEIPLYDKKPRPRGARWAKQHPLMTVEELLTQVSK